MRILQIGASFVGAQQKIEGAIHDYLLAHGHESYILYAIGESKDPRIMCYESKLAYILCRTLRKLFGKKPVFAYFGTRRIIRKIKELKPDLVNLHILHHGYVDYVTLLNFLAKKQITVIYTAHDMWAFTGGCYYYTNINCSGFQSGCANCPKTTAELDCSKNETGEYLRKKLNLFAQLHDVRFVSVSPWVYDEMLKSQLRCYPQHMIMNSVDDSEYMPKETRKREKFTVIGVAAAWDARKGIHRFFELGQLLGDSADILLVGHVSEQFKQVAPANVTFLGSVSDKEKLYELYASCDLHVSMSLEETFGLTFVEAALAGIKSLGFNSTAVPFVLKNTYGYIIDANDVEAAANKIQQVAKQRDMCRMSEMEIATVRKMFSTERMGQEYMEVFEEAYQSRRKKGERCV